MRIDKVRLVRDLAQEVVRLLDSATEAAHRQREDRNKRYAEVGSSPLTGPLEVGGTQEAAALRRRSMDLTRALAEMRQS